MKRLNVAMLSLLLAIILLCEPVRSDRMQMNKACGDVKCQEYFYCDGQEGMCKECSLVCKESSHNYDQTICERHCQDYILDKVKGYVQIGDLNDVVSSLYSLLVVIIILLVLVLGLVGGMVFRIVYRYRRRKRQRKLEDKKFQEKLSAVQYSVNNNNSMRDGTIKCIGHTIGHTMPSTTTLTTTAESPCSTNRASSTKTLPSSKEEPSEDTTLDYASYINQGMSHSPSSANGLNVTPKY